MTVRVTLGTRLSPREEEILSLIRTTDLSYFSIGRYLVPHMTANTVATHAQRAYRRLGVCGRIGYLVSLQEGK